MLKDVAVYVLGHMTHPFSHGNFNCIHIYLIVFLFFFVVKSKQLKYETGLH